MFHSLYQKIQEVLRRHKGTLIPLSCVNCEGHKGASSTEESGILCPVKSSPGKAGENVKTGLALRRATRTQSSCEQGAVSADKHLL